MNLQLVLFGLKFFLIKLCYALNAKYYVKAPSRNLERGKEVEEIASSFPYSQEEGKRESFGSSWCVCFEMKRESSLMIKEVLLKCKFYFKCYGLFSCMRFLGWKDLCMWKRENLWRMVHSSKFKFFFQFPKFYLLIERQISPPTILRLKIWENVVIMGRLCQNVYKIMCRKLQQLNNA